MPLRGYARLDELVTTSRLPLELNCAIRNDEKPSVLEVNCAIRDDEESTDPC